MRLTIPSISIFLNLLVNENHARTFGTSQIAWGRPQISTETSLSSILTTRGGGTKSKEVTEADEVESPDAEDLYLPGLLQANIVKSNKVRPK